MPRQAKNWRQVQIAKIIKAADAAQAECPVINAVSEGPSHSKFQLFWTR